MQIHTDFCKTTDDTKNGKEKTKIIKSLIYSEKLKTHYYSIALGIWRIYQNI